MVLEQPGAGGAPLRLEKGMKHKDIELYVALAEGGCADVGHINLYGFTLVQDTRLFELEATEQRLNKWESVFGHLGEPDDIGNEWLALCDKNACLLEALKRCKFDSLNMTLEDCEFCRAAIAKATGEQL